MLGTRPYVGYSRQEIRDKVIAKEVQIRKADVPFGWSLEAADFVNKLIIRKAAFRLGAKGIDEVKRHPWLKSLSWAKLASKAIPAPFTPYFRAEHSDQGEVTLEDNMVDLVRENTVLLRDQKVQKLFAGYDCLKK
jgi:hypothetical protein